MKTPEQVADTYREGPCGHYAPVGYADHIKRGLGCRWCLVDAITEYGKALAQNATAPRLPDLLELRDEEKTLPTIMLCAACYRTEEPCRCGDEPAPPVASA